MADRVSRRQSLDGGSSQQNPSTSRDDAPPISPFDQEQSRRPWNFLVPRRINPLPSTDISSPEAVGSGRSPSGRLFSFRRHSAPLEADRPRAPDNPEPRRRMTNPLQIFRSNSAP